MQLKELIWDFYKQCGQDRQSALRSVSIVFLETQKNGLPEPVQ